MKENAKEKEKWKGSLYPQTNTHTRARVCELSYHNKV